MVFLNIMKKSTFNYYALKYGLFLQYHPSLHAVFMFTPEVKPSTVGSCSRAVVNIALYFPPC